MKREAGRTCPSRFTVAVRQGLRKHSPSLLMRARDLSDWARVGLGYPAPGRQSIRRAAHTGSYHIQKINCCHGRLKPLLLPLRDVATKQYERDSG